MANIESRKLKEDLYWVGTRDYGLKTFDIIMETKYGSTYNSFLVKGSEACAIFETVKVQFVDEYIERLESIANIEDIKYLVVSHTEPDHSGSIAKILEINPDIQVIASQMAINFLKEIVNKDFNYTVVKSGDEISLGDKTLKFEVIPNLHWPDTMYTFIPELKSVVTCDSFGSHYAVDEILLSEQPEEDMEDYYDAREYYYDVILSPFKQPFMQKGTDFVRNNDIDMILVGHGPIIDVNIDELLDTYDKWNVAPVREDKVTIGYVSSYGYTGILADAIADELRKNNVEATIFNLEETDNKEVLADLETSKGLLLGSPTILGDAVFPVYDFMSEMFPVTSNQIKASAFGVYGWSGEAVKNMIGRMDQLRMKTTEGFRSKFKPSDEDLENVRAWAKEFADNIKA